jgi:FixJ family two-component response regulator
MIAIVDDDRSVQEAVRDLLESDGRSVRCFDGAEDFLASGIQDEIGCLVTDVRMPGMSGTELQRRLLDDGCKVPVIFITAHRSDEQSRARALGSGAVAYLLKPFDQNELLDAVHGVLG